MNTRTFPFVILRARPSKVRGESLNIGIIAFVDGKIIARIDADPTRLRAFDPDLAVLPIWVSLQADIEKIADTLLSIESQHHLLKSILDPIFADDKIGQIILDDGEDINDRIESLMMRLVHRPARTLASIRQSKQNKATKLNLELRNWFKTVNVFSRNVSDLSKHRVVPNYPIAANNDIYAEFALKNGDIHVIETLDFRNHDKVTVTVQKEAAIKSIVLDQANRSLGQGSKKFAVIAASDYGAMRPVISLISGYADDVITMASSQDRQRLADFISASLHSQPLLPAMCQ